MYNSTVLKYLIKFYIFCPYEMGLFYFLRFIFLLLSAQDLRKAGLLVFANKQDVKGCMSVAEISQSLQLTSVKDHQWHIQACCALTGEG